MTATVPDPATGTPGVLCSGYRIRTDIAHDPASHAWVSPSGPVRVRVGLDPLGVETTGTLVQLLLPLVGERVHRGGGAGTVEAAKFVGPLPCPVTGSVAAVNVAVAADPGLVERDPYGEGWLFDIDVDDLAGDLAGLLVGEEAVTGWFAAAVADYRARGVIAQ